MSANETENPDFFSWNKVVVKHCDGGASSGGPASPVKRPLDNAGAVDVKRRKIHALIDSVLKQGMHKAQTVLVSGMPPIVLNMKKCWVDGFAIGVARTLIRFARIRSVCESVRIANPSCRRGSQ